MLKTISKFVLVAAVAATAVSFSTPSYAAKKKRRQRRQPASRGNTPRLQCNGTVCHMNRCGLDGKWYPSLLICWQPACPK